MWVTISQIREVYHTSIEAQRHVLKHLPAVESDSLEDFVKAVSESYTPPPPLEIPGMTMSAAEAATSIFNIITMSICTTKPHAEKRVTALRRKQEFAGWVLEDLDDIEDLRTWLLCCNRGFESGFLSQRRRILCSISSTKISEMPHSSSSSSSNQTRIILGRASAIDGSCVAWHNTADGGLPLIIKTYMSIATSNLKKLYKEKEGREERLAKFGCPPQRKNACVPRIRFAGWDHFRTGLSFVEFDSSEQRELAMHLFFGNTQAQQFCRFHVVSDSAPSFFQTSKLDEEEGNKFAATLKLSGDTDSMKRLINSIRMGIDSGRHGGRPEHSKNGVLRGGSMCAPIQNLFGKFGRCEVEFVDYRQMINAHLEEATRLSSEINVDRVTPSGDMDSFIPEALRWSSFAVSRLVQSLKSGNDPQLAIQEFALNQGHSSVAHSGIESIPFFKIRFLPRQASPEAASLNACSALWELQPYIACAWGLTLTQEVRFSSCSPGKAPLNLDSRIGKIPAKDVSRYWEPAASETSSWNYNFQNPQRHQLQNL